MMEVRRGKEMRKRVEEEKTNAREVGEFEVAVHAVDVLHDLWDAVAADVEHRRVFLEDGGRGDEKRGEERVRDKNMGGEGRR